MTYKKYAETLAELHAIVTVLVIASEKTTGLDDTLRRQIQNAFQHLFSIFPEDKKVELTEPLNLDDYPILSEIE